MVSGMFGCVGEDYSTLESIRLTGGIAPDATWAENLGNIQSEAALAATLGFKLVTFHAGFLPLRRVRSGLRQNGRTSPYYRGLVRGRQLTLALETGQETAAALRQLLLRLDRPNVGVNFDPANMILYGKGNPIEALGVLGPWIRQVHIKDATRARTPGTGPRGSGRKRRGGLAGLFRSAQILGLPGELCHRTGSRTPAVGGHPPGARGGGSGFLEQRLVNCMKNPTLK